MDKYSSRRDASRILATTDDFLLRLANDLEYAEVRYPELMPPALRFGVFAALAHNRPCPPADAKPKPQVASEADVALAELQDYQRLIRAVWVAPSSGQRRYWAYKLREKLYAAIEQQQRAAIPKTVRLIAKGQFERIAAWNPEYGDIARQIPDEVPFDEVIARLESLAGLTKLCGNPECAAPYFIATRRSQRYCTEKCAGVFQQEQKREWWRQHGKEWRQGRAQREDGK